MTVHNLLELWKLTDKVQVGLLGFDLSTLGVSTENAMRFDGRQDTVARESSCG